MDLIETIVSRQLPGIYVPKLTKQECSVLKGQVVTAQSLFPDPGQPNQINGVLQRQFKILSNYLLKLSSFPHIIRNAAVKVFLEKKSDLRNLMLFILK